MFWTAAAESTHHHITRTESTSCSICVAAHSSSPTAGSTHAGPVFARVGMLHDEEVLAKAQFLASNLGIRGPPAIL
jgi:predicted flavoprotein YhiN